MIIHIRTLVLRTTQAISLTNSLIKDDSALIGSILQFHDLTHLRYPDTCPSKEVGPLAYNNK